MTTLEELAAQQEEAGSEIQSIISNYKKDPPSRKNLPYYQERLRRLENVWTKFETTDNFILTQHAQQSSHPYFSKGYYEATRVIYQKYADEFQEKITALTAETVQPTEKPTLAVSTQEDQRNTLSKLQPSQGKDEASGEVSRVIRKQGAVVESLRRFLTRLDETDGQLSRQAYQEKISTITRYWSQVESLHHNIWELTENPANQGYNATDYFNLEERVQDTLIRLSEKLASMPSTSVSSSMMKLPKVVLPKFDGDYLKWRQFYDLFNQMVHNQPLGACQKMWYLKTHLTGDAEKLIRHLSLSDDNYLAAWNMLKDRYDNHRLLVTALLNKLLSQPSMNAESPSSIKALHDITQECLLGLENLGVDTTNWDPLLFHILTRKLDRTTHGMYEQSLSHPKKLPVIKEFLSFLETRFQSLEALGNKPKHIEEHNRKQSAKSFTSVVKSAPQRACCKANHPLFACQRFLKMTPTNRFNLLKRANLCINCLRSGHSVSKCTSRGCSKCSKRHNTLVHIESAFIPVHKNEKSSTTDVQLQVKEAVNTSPEISHKLEENATTLSTRGALPKRGYVVLGTIVINLKNHKGNSVECRAILDSGSQLNFITEKLVKELGLNETSEMMQIQGIGQSRQHTQRRVSVSLQSKTSSFSTRLEAYVLPKITSYQPAQPLDITSWPIPCNIALADPQFHRPDRVDFLIGAEIYYQIMSVGQIRLADNLPTLQNTVFGWVVTGRAQTEGQYKALCGICSEDERAEQQLERFWKLEEVDSSDEDTRITTSEQRCVNHFVQNVKRTSEGRFIVRLPFSQDPKILGESQDLALQRFLSLERKLNRQPVIKAQYIEFIREYIRLGHMQQISPVEITKPHYFLPHHCVTKSESSTTKLRVVFDASAKTSSNVSLNDILYKGPTIQDELFTILLRFRMPKFVFTADIEKMYRQVLLHDDDQFYQLILWREDASQPINYYKLRTVTYGTTSAPFLATSCLESIANSEKTKYPLGSEILKRDFYVDDVMTGSNSLIEAKEMQRQLKELLQSGGFNLRKWCANHPQLLQHHPEEDIELKLDFSDGVEGHVKTLGLTWLPKSDNFSINTTWDDTKRVTKRSVLSDIAHIFDPLGFVNPVTVIAKLFIQKLWALKIDWDAALPMEMHTSWLEFRKGLKKLNEIKIPRHVFSKEQPKSIQIHAFSDASERAYGAAIYIRTTSQNGVVIVRLLCAKSKVAPLKTITLPRLELCAAKLSAQLTQRILKDLLLQDVKSYYWTDSEIVLAWINSDSSDYHTFVANRVASIQRLSSTEQWRHVRSKDNPADIVSRGMAAEKLTDCSMWFYGPPFLHGTDACWPPKYSKVSTALEKRKSKITLTTTTRCPQFIGMIEHGNSFKRLQRIIAYALRFIHNIRHPSRSIKGNPPLRTEELEAALIIILKEVQQDGFTEDLTQLRQTDNVDSRSSLNSLSPFLDENGIIRVGGRLQHSNLTYDAKHPMLLPYSHQVTKLLMTDLHVNNLHAGPQTLLAITRQRFWPIKGKTIARSIVQNCVRCNKVKPKLMNQLMGNLPSARVQPARPFVNSGVDFCGPIWTHYKVRGKHPQKSYIAVFCCFATKATHLEVVSDLTTDGLLGALKRFVARRGYCKDLFCDNATNFVGARNQLSELQGILYSNESQDKISTLCQQKGIQFHFIPPRAPHFGGLWEASIKSAKALLQRSVATASLTYEELTTVAAEIEAVLNSRPITPLSSDPNDLTALTPGHFLVGEPLTAVVDPHSSAHNLKLLQRWKLVSHIKHEFWRRWSKEYLCELQHRHKWKQPSKNACPGMMVVIKEDNLPPLKWQLGRIVQVIKGNDGLVRVADVKTTSGIMRRPIHKLAPLPVDREDNPPSRESPERASTSREMDDDDQNSDPSPSKKRRQATSSALSVFLLTCLIMPVIGHSPVEILPFESQPGIYFENLGATHLVSNEWNLVVYYDMMGYWKEYQSIKSGISKLYELCDLLTAKTYCSLITRQVTSLQEELRNNNELLLPTPRKRISRAPLNIVGNIASALFGVLDSEYAEKMAITIDNIKENEDKLLKLIENQTSILESTTNILKRSEEIVQNQFREVDLQLNQIVNRVNNISELIHQQQVSQLFTSLAIQITLMSSTFRRAQTSLIDVMTDTHHGKINPQLLSPMQLKEALSTIKDHLPSNLKLPEYRDNLVQLYSLMTIQGRMSTKYAIFRLKLPIFTIEEFEMFHIIPVPVAINNTFFAIKPSAEFMVINLHRDQYYPLGEQEMYTCMNFAQAYHICKQKHPIYRKGADITSCEMSFMNHLPPSPRCQTMKIEGSSKWIQLHNPNEWIYSVKEKTPINIVCGTNTIQQILEGAGRLKIQANCAIKQELVTIQSHNVYPTALRSSFMPATNLADIMSPEQLAELPHGPIHFQDHKDELEKLQQRILELKETQTLPQEIKAVDIHQFTLGYLALLLGAAVSVSLLCRWARKKFQRKKNKPIPKPRQSTHQPFTISISDEDS